MPSEQQTPSGGGLIARLGQLLGVKSDEVEAVLRHDAVRARATLRRQRRGFLGAAAALAAAPLVPKAFIEVPAFEPLAYTMTMTTNWTDLDLRRVPKELALGQAQAISAVFTWVAINAL